MCIVQLLHIFYLLRRLWCLKYFIFLLSPVPNYFIFTFVFDLKLFINIPSKNCVSCHFTLYPNSRAWNLINRNVFVENINKKLNYGNAHEVIIYVSLWKVNFCQITGTFTFHIHFSYIFNAIYFARREL